MRLAAVGDGFLAYGRIARMGATDDARLGLDRGLRAPLSGPWAALPWALALPQLALGVGVPAIFQLAQLDRVRDTAVWMACLALLGVYPLVTLARLGEPDHPRALHVDR